MDVTSAPLSSPRTAGRSGLAVLANRWRELGLARQKVVYALLGIAIIMAFLGNWTSGRIQSGVLTSMTTSAALYMENFVSPLVRDYDGSSELDGRAIEALDRLVADPAFRRQIASIKVWAKDGRLLYAQDKEQIGKRFPISANLQRAVEGRLSADYEPPDEEENERERGLGLPLVEIYTPILRETSGDVVSVVEFYAIATALERELRRSRIESWLIVSVIALLVLSAIVALVSGDGATIARQEKALQNRVAQLSRLLVHNEELRQKLVEARRGAVETNERVLRRIGADLHDGPAQLIGLALLRLDNLTPRSSRKDAAVVKAELETIRGALNSSLSEIRVLSSGIAPPALERVQARDAIEMAVANHEQHTGTDVDCKLGALPLDLPALLKTCLYRFTQEGLTNAFRHAKAAGQRVRAGTEAGVLFLEVQDDGPGFVQDFIPSTQRGLGLSGLRDRVESLGGVFSIRSEPGQHTTLRCEFTLEPTDIPHA
ncbi:MAG: sensor histidine kinase [Alsobacter sp.]